MQVKIRLHGPLAKYAVQPNLHSIDIAPDLSLGQLMDQLKLPSSAISFVAVNGVKSGVDYQLRESDQILIFPYVAGG